VGHANRGRTSRSANQVKPDSGRHGTPLFSRKARRKYRLPLSLFILAALVLLFSLIRPGGFFTSINPANVVVPAFTPTPTALPRPTNVHGGHIVFTCTRKAINQICVINADGTGYQQLTYGNSNAYYPAISPDGDQVVFALNKYDNFDLNVIARDGLALPPSLRSGMTALTDGIGDAFSPLFSSDGTQILFVNRTRDNPSALWLMGRNGEDPHVIYQPAQDIVGAAWSPDGRTIAIAMAADARFAYEVFLLDFGNLSQSPRRVSHGLDGIGGGLSWSHDKNSLLIFAGPVAAREIYRLDIATGSFTQLTFGGNNAAGAYSPDGQFIVFNSLRTGGQADLYIMRADGHSMRQLTSNPEPDWQPQWGP
jgi:Tol biopolymer transport system component